MEFFCGKSSIFRFPRIALLMAYEIFQLKNTCSYFADKIFKWFPECVFNRFSFTQTLKNKAMAKTVTKVVKKAAPKKAAKKAAPKKAAKKAAPKAAVKSAVVVKKAAPKKPAKKAAPKKVVKKAAPKKVVKKAAPKKK